MIECVCMFVCVSVYIWMDSWKQISVLFILYNTHLLVTTGCVFFNVVSAPKTNCYTVKKEHYVCIYLCKYFIKCFWLNGENNVWQKIEHILLWPCVYHTVVNNLIKLTLFTEINICILCDGKNGRYLFWITELIFWTITLNFIS